jgi:hypothetical protein
LIAEQTRPSPDLIDREQGHSKIIEVSQGLRKGLNGLTRTAVTPGTKNREPQHQAVIVLRFEVLRKTVCGIAIHKKGTIFQGLHKIGDDFAAVLTGVIIDNQEL